MTNDPRLMPLHSVRALPWWPWRPAAVLAVAAAACGASAACSHASARKPIEMEPIGTVPNVKRVAAEDGDAGGAVTAPNSAATPAAVAKEAACTGSEFDDLAQTLAGCDVVLPRQADLPAGLREKLEIKLAAAPATVSGGGRADLAVTFKNRTSEPLTLYFSGEPNPRLEIEAVDARGRRVDLPPGRPPKITPRESKSSRVILLPGGTARLRGTWDAVKTKWAASAKGWEGRGAPRAPAGSLPAGKYTLRIVLPLVGDVETPKHTIDVTGG